VLWQFATTLDLVAGFVQHWRQITRALDEVDAFSHKWLPSSAEVDCPATLEAATKW
jgi:hypothetical protein